MRRNSRTIRFVETKKPAEKREDARKRLESVTEVSNVAVSGLYAVKEGSEERKESTDSVSILEQDWCVVSKVIKVLIILIDTSAICLSTLHTPSPPEPAKLAAGDIEAARPSSVSGLSISEQDILRLKACGHEFHAQCLISWFIIRKYSCPICRAWYYGKNAELKLNEEHDSDISGSQSIHDRNESNRRREG